MWDGEYCQLVEKLFQLFSDKMKVIWDWARNKNIIVITLILESQLYTWSLEPVLLTESWDINLSSSLALSW